MLHGRSLGHAFFKARSSGINATLTIEDKGRFDIDVIRASFSVRTIEEKQPGDTFRECRPAIWNGS